MSKAKGRRWWRGGDAERREQEEREVWVRKQVKEEAEERNTTVSRQEKYIYSGPTWPPTHSARSHLWLVSSDVLTATGDEAICAKTFACEAA